MQGESEKNMTVKNIFDMGLVDDSTEIFIRDEDFHVLGHGDWYQDNVLEYLNHNVESFTWQDDNKFYIDITKEQAAG